MYMLERYTSRNGCKKGSCKNERADLNFRYMNKPANLTVLVNLLTILLLHINVNEINILPFILLHFLVTCTYLVQEMMGISTSYTFFISRTSIFKHELKSSEN
jgi:hypothetical protein